MLKIQTRETSEATERLVRIQTRELEAEAERREAEWVHANPEAAPARAEARAEVTRYYRELALFSLKTVTMGCFVFALLFFVVDFV